MKRNDWHLYIIAPIDKANRPARKSGLTLASNNVRITKDDEAVFGFVDNLPVEIGSSGRYLASLSPDETNVNVLVHIYVEHEDIDPIDISFYASPDNEIADAVLKRDWTLVTGAASRSVLNALRKLRNRFALSGTTLTVYQEDDSTPAYTQTATTDPNADPLTALEN